MIINRITLLSAFLLVFTFTGLCQVTTANYIEKHKPLAVELMREYAIPASVILGVAVVESGAGTSVLSRKFNNHFGIIGKNYNAVKKLGKRSHYKEYESSSDSFRHFCEIVSKKPFYAGLRSNPDPAAWVKAIQKSGYSTAAQTWGKRVDLVIRKYNLSDIDLTVDPLNQTAQLLN